MAVRTLIILFGFSILGFNSTRLKTERLKTIQPDYNLALEFINDYVDFLNDSTKEISRLEWVNQHQDLTRHFKTEFTRLITVAEAKDPELGIGFDPILDAQDHPNQFEIDQIDSEYIIVKGVNWTEFRLTLKLKHSNKKWLVEGSGIVNVPKEKRIER